MPTADEIAAFLDEVLASPGFPDYPGALNGLQLNHQGPVRRIAAAVDFSRRAIEAAIAQEANLLLVHHGMFWSGTERLVGPAYERLRLLITHDIAVYASHLPLDAHPELGNNVLLARSLELGPSGPFGSFGGASIGVAGESEIPTTALFSRADAFARAHGGVARASYFASGRMTRRWAIITGAGAGSSEIQEARQRGIDTLIVGEGPHHTTVNAPEAELVILYAGHYATETQGIRALAAAAGGRFGLPHDFLYLPTGS